VHREISAHELGGVHPGDVELLEVLGELRELGTGGAGAALGGATRGERLELARMSEMCARSEISMLVAKVPRRG
jgi:hypothetical protein